MRYDVIWRPRALARLADLWNQAADRNAVAAASDQIDDELERDPLGVGESRGGIIRVHLVAPLGVYYSVDATARTVTVRAVWRF
jgi:hypothetical protein